MYEYRHDERWDPMENSEKWHLREHELKTD
jgi:hypothetical protein